MTESSAPADTTRERPGPLSDIKVVDLTHWAAGPVASMVLGDLGADVLKIEPPGGEPQRGMGVTFPGGWSTFFLACQRNKRFVSINYRDPRGRELVRKLAETADVVMENARPGTWERHGLDYDTLRALNPKLIYASITGFGQTGPMRDWLAMDPIAQAAGGVVGITGSPEGGPAKVGAAITDVVSGRLAAFGVVTALYDRMRTGVGQRVDASLFATAVSLLTMRETEFQFTQQNPPLLGTAHGQIVPAEAFTTRDDRRVMLCIYSDWHWARFAELAGMPALAQDDRFTTNAARCAHRVATIAAVQDVIRQRTEAEWTELLAGEIPYGPVLEFDQLWAHPQLDANELIARYDMPGVGEVRTIGSPIRFSGFTQPVRRVPAAAGSDTVEVLRENGLSEAEIEELVAAGVVHTAQSGITSSV
jgi:crotonobetainyl-CoA:carnitine CoA-transferase CaiB-like acyl-CoA transferase